ncbi:hypothetical protein GGG16DRAFT_42278 [Schizophyllum commune]
MSSDTVPSSPAFPDTFPLLQDLYKGVDLDVRVTQRHYKSAGRALQDFKTALGDAPVGLATINRQPGHPVVLALASDTQVLVLKFGSGQLKASHAVMRMLRDLLGNYRRIFVFGGDELALGLHEHLDIHVGNMIDLLGVACAHEERRTLTAYLEALGGEGLSNDAGERILSKDVAGGMMRVSGTGNIRDVALEAWAAGYAGRLRSMQIKIYGLQRIDTVNLEPSLLIALYKLDRDQRRRQAVRPTRITNEIAEAVVGKGNGHLQVVSARYKTRVTRTNRDQHIEVTHAVDGNEVTFQGRATKIDGRNATIACAGGKLPASGKNGAGKTNDKPGHANQLNVQLTTVGRESSTIAERTRASIVHIALRHQADLFDQPFFCAIFLPEEDSWDEDAPTRPSLPIRIAKEDALNDSQRTALERILSGANEDRLVLVQGPPGTGKTTVIAGAVESIVRGDGKRTVWLVAQSNVAVKNMAEKLADVGFLEFRVLVSKDFHHDWHEHLYEKIEHRLIRSDDFPETPNEASRLLGDARVVLCTLSALAVGRLQSVTHVVPLQTVLVDEASQIEIGDLLPMLHLHHNRLEKVVFIGDDRQYRMPTFLGEFISQHVYDGQLLSEHRNKNADCCRFVDVAEGKETRAGKSWKATSATTSSSRSSALSVRASSRSSVGSMSC